MAFVTDKFIFAHLPKTGGKFVRYVLEEFGITGKEVGNFHAAPMAVTKAGVLQPVMITIRHPVTWYQSRWMHRIKYGWSPSHPVDWECASNDFNQFVLNVIDYDPNGRFTSLVQLFRLRARPSTQIEYILKNETLTQELFVFLNKLGYDIDKAHYFNLPKVNTSGKTGEQSSDIAQYDPEVLDKLIKHESWVIDTYYNGISDPNALLDQLAL